ncbi:hypothetical protein [Primorskyibacter sp. 2E233]|uniref:hypothetical protein n=1 Tax=Primorskyibacter sp. 2E233 TaxID=3413431 RepID=UPI003BF0D50C
MPEMTSMTKPLSLVFFLAAAPVAASDAVLGEETIHQSPNGIAERCVRITPVPGGTYDKDDLEQEAAYCAIDLYPSDVAMCPKTWSTSPGTMIYDIADGPYAGDRATFERNACKEGKSAGTLAADTLAKFKPTMNAKGTSGTFSASPLLYYHFSRYFDMTVKVPVTVWRSIDAGEHLAEVGSEGLSLSGGSHGGRMNHAGWRALVAAEKDPKSYQPTDDLFTADRSQIYGVLTSSPGHRYGTEINGTRVSGWGKGQNEDFQKTPAFLALRSDKPLVEAIEHGLTEGRKDRQIAKDLGQSVTPQQMAYWMKELTEIVILDFILSQQDRVGNIDFTPYYYWLDGGKLEHKKAKHHEPRDGTVPADAILLRRTNLNDNDAGGRVQYANFAKSTQMLEKLRHMNAGTYEKLMALSADLQGGGAIATWLATSFGLTEREVAQVVGNTTLAAGLLRDSCNKGLLTFDLEPAEFFKTGSVVDRPVSCDGN